jgi:hypothetical protein
MNAFVFKPTNDFIGKFSIRKLEDIPRELPGFLSANTVPLNSYVEASGHKLKIVSLAPLTLHDESGKEISMAVNPEASSPHSPLEIAAFFLCGGFLVLAGAVAGGGLAGAGLEIFLRTNYPASAANSPAILLSIASLIGIGLAALGSFVAKQDNPPVWFLLITGIVPGFLLSQGWYAIHGGTAAKKGLQATGLNRAIIITIGVILLLSLSIFNK